MADVPRRYKNHDELSVDELVQVENAKRRDKPTPRFETSEYVGYRADALREAGLDDEADQLTPAEPLGLEEMSPAEHLERIQAGNRPG